MKCVLFITLTVFFATCLISSVQALECGIDKGPNQRELRQVAENCMKKKIVEKKTSTVSEDEEEEEEEGKEVVTETQKMERNKRSERTDNNEHQFSDFHDDNMKMDNNNTTANETCVVLCIFEQLGMTDNNGFPEHHRVSQALLKNTSGRELRDFIQDTTDECFQLMDQGDHHDPCQYAKTLVSCLADRGKSNCADWPIGNLPFLTSKN